MLLLLPSLLRLSLLLLLLLPLPLLLPLFLLQHLLLLFMRPAAPAGRADEKVGPKGKQMGLNTTPQDSKAPRGSFGWWVDGGSR